MHASWKADRRRTLWIAALGLALWALFIFWQGEITWLGFREALAALFAFNLAAIPVPFGSLFLDVLLFIASGVFWVLLFAHYILPIQRPNELGKVLKVMGRSLLGTRPAALIFRNGHQYKPSRENRKGKPGIFILDSASAAVLRNAQAYTRAIGPGLSFARDKEYLAGSLDLRIQRRFLGPLPGDEAFAAQQQGEEPVSFRTRQERRQETSAFTKEGVEIAPRIEVDFRLEGRTPKHGRPYPFQAEFAWRALAHEGSAAHSSANEQAQQISWDWLPVHLATDLWREYLGIFSVHELFDTESGVENTLTGLERLEKYINMRLTNAIVPESFSANKISTRNTSSAEFQLMRSRGLRVLSVRLRELHLDPLRDETRLVNEWSEAWEMRSIQTSIKDDSRNEVKEISGQQAAAAEFLRLVSSQLYTRLKATDGKNVLPPDQMESLELLLMGSLQGAAQVPALDPEVSERLQVLAHLLNGKDDKQD